MSIAAIGAVVPPLEPAFQARAATQGGSAFVVTPEPAALQLPTGGAAGVPAGSLSAMMALQEAGSAWSPTGRPADRQARQHGRGLLAALASLQRDLLDTADPAASLNRLVDLLADVPDPEDQQLGQILGAIRLRAGIEAIRLGRRGLGAPLA